jgi:hypothetical protein
VTGPTERALRATLDPDALVADAYQRGRTEALRLSQIEPAEAIRVLGAALGYAPHGTGEHTLVTLAEEAAQALADARRLVHAALHLRQFGERAPGGRETWAEWDRTADAWSRRQADPDCPHDSESGNEGPIAELGRWPRRWRCDSCGRVRVDPPVTGGGPE